MVNETQHSTDIRKKKEDPSAYLALGTVFGFAIGWLWFDRMWEGLIIGMFIGLLIDSIRNDSRP
jgi:hypothetical protein